MSEKSTCIKLSDIDVKNTHYKISSGEEDLTSLVESIKEAGLINPPIVRSCDNKFIIISGFKRVNACLLNQQTYIRVRLLTYDSKDLDFISAISAISENAFQKGLTIYEIIKSVSLLGKFWDEKTICKKSRAVLNMDLGQKYIKNLHKVISMPRSVLQLLKESKLSLKAALRLGEFDNDTIGLFAGVFSKIKVSSNKQLDIIGFFKEISSREDIILADLIKSIDIKTILESENPDQGYKGNLLRSFLYQRRYPTVFKTKSEFNDAVKALKLHKDIKIEAPLDFEGMTYQVRLSFNDISTFKQHIKKLETVSDAPSLKEILQ
jgi:ParB family transcriptional regulator, chromosome partitioning protein